MKSPTVGGHTLFMAARPSVGENRKQRFVVGPPGRVGSSAVPGACRRTCSDEKACDPRLPPPSPSMRQGGGVQREDGHAVAAGITRPEPTRPAGGRGSPRGDGAEGEG